MSIYEQQKKENEADYQSFKITNELKGRMFDGEKAVIRLINSKRRDAERLHRIRKEQENEKISNQRK